MSARLFEHPAAHIFPDMSAEQYAALREDIRERGQREPITVHEGKLVDGRHRYRACKELGIEPRIREWKGPGSVLDYVISVNLKRRHLTEKERVNVGLAALPLAEAEAKARQLRRPVAATKSVSASVRSQNQEPRKAAADVARKVGVSPRLMEQGIAVQKKAPAMLTDPRIKTIGQAVREIKRAATHERIREESKASAPTPSTKSARRFPVLYADPPWQYEAGSIDDSRVVENQYPTMALDAIKALRLPSLADAVLFLWATSPKLAEAMEVIAAWGFRYRTCAVWTKPRLGMGYYFRQQHELLLVATRGALPVPEPSARVTSVFTTTEALRHSEKPAAMRAAIEQMYPDLPRIELFARERFPGWESWGNEVKA